GYVSQAKGEPTRNDASTRGGEGQRRESTRARPAGRAQRPGPSRGRCRFVTNDRTSTRLKEGGLNMTARRTMEMHRITLACIAARVTQGEQEIGTTTTRRGVDPRFTYENICPRGDYAGARARAFAQFKAKFGPDSSPQLLGW